MNISEITYPQLRELVEGIVDDRLRELIGDPDLGLALSEEVRARLKQSLISSERVTGDEIAEKLGLRW
jgi:hypothetical protein